MWVLTHTVTNTVTTCDLHLHRAKTNTVFFLSSSGKSQSTQHSNPTRFKGKCIELFWVMDSITLQDFSVRVPQALGSCIDELVNIWHEQSEQNAKSQHDRMSFRDAGMYTYINIHL